MLFAITADVHLSSSHPERMKHFKAMVESIHEQGINQVIIAGDLFDKDYNGYNEFDNLAKEYVTKELVFHIVPGNHDIAIKKELFNAGNITVYTKPTLKEIGDRQFLFLPYTNNKSMGEVIEEAELKDELVSKQWVLISHGDFGVYSRETNGNEDGYFPLSVLDIQKYQPHKVILGHIHKPLDEPIYYPGSPYPVDKNEFGQRRYLVFDSESGYIKTTPLTDTPVYAIMNILVIPDGEEIEQVDKKIDGFLGMEQNAYKGDNLLDYLNVRVNISGYTKSRESFDTNVAKLLKDRGIQSSEIDINKLKYSDNDALNKIASEVEKEIMDMELDYSDDIRRASVEQAFAMIYGGE